MERKKDRWRERKIDGEKESRQRERKVDREKEKDTTD